MRISCVLVAILAFLSFPQSATLFTENFEDTNFASRSWYDSPRATLSTQEHLPGSTRCFECFFKQGTTGCNGGTPGRRLFAESETVLLSFWVKYSTNYVGSGKPYHPHLFHFVTNKDDRWVGPSYTHLTTYTEQVGGKVRIALQDGRNNDPNCILLNNGSFVGCNGNASTYHFTESRSVCACNGVVGDSGGRDCFNQGNGTYYSARYWDSRDIVFTDSPGPYYKSDWHFIESYFQMNSVSNGIGIADGVIQYWYDGKLVIDLHHVLFRTSANADMKFNQFLIAPYIGDGSPVDQYMWIDNLTVSTSRAGNAVPQPGYARRTIWEPMNFLAAPGSERALKTGIIGSVYVIVTDHRGRMIEKSSRLIQTPDQQIGVVMPRTKGIYHVLLCPSKSPAKSCRVCVQ